MSRESSAKLVPKKEPEPDRVAFLLDSTLYPFVEVSADGHRASAQAVVVLRDRTRLSWADYKAQLKVALEAQEA